MISICVIKPDFYNKCDLKSKSFYLKHALYMHEPIK